MNIGVMLPMVRGLITSGSFVRDLAGALEECGVESAWAVEHVLVAEDHEPRYPYSQDGRLPGLTQAVMPDPLELLSFVAAASTSLRLGTAVVVAPLHSPVVLAKRAATLDALSGGRFMLGVGIGWQKEEYEAVGAAYRDRGRRLDEAIEVMRTLWAPGVASFHGRFTSFSKVNCDPRPPNPGGIPVIIGGSSSVAASRSGRLGDGWFPYVISPEDFEARVAELRAAATETGRDPTAIEITAWPGSFDPGREVDVDFVRRYIDAGARRIVINAAILEPNQLPALRERLLRFRGELGE